MASPTFYDHVALRARDQSMGLSVGAGTHPLTKPDHQHGGWECVTHYHRFFSHEIVRREATEQFFFLKLEVRRLLDKQLSAQRHTETGRGRQGVGVWEGGCTRFTL